MYNAWKLSSLKMIKQKRRKGWMGEEREKEREADREAGGRK